jgi:hypothetical protein
LAAPAAAAFDLALPFVPFEEALNARRASTTMKHLKRGLTPFLYRFSLRTLLIATTLVAIVLGLIVAVM